MMGHNTIEEPPSSCKFPSYFSNHHLPLVLVQNIHMIKFTEKKVVIIHSTKPSFKCVCVCVCVCVCALVCAHLCMCMRANVHVYIFVCAFV